ncbi:MAG: hypothetical protein ACXVAN_02800, partial [Polyangia bacterium]
MRASSSDLLAAAEASKKAEKEDEKDLGRIDTDRQKVPSALMPSPLPLSSDELRGDRSEGGYSRIDTLPDGFAD